MLGLPKLLALSGFTLLALLASAPPSLALSNPPPSHRDHAALARRLAPLKPPSARKIRAHSSPAGGKRNIDGTRVVKRGDGSLCKIRTTTTNVSAAVAGTTSASTTSAAVTTTSTTVAPTTTSATPAPTTSSAAAAAVSISVSVGTGSTNNGGSTGKNAGHKLGLAWPNGNWAGRGDANYVGNYIGSRSSWYYTWSPYSVGSADSEGLEFVPMLWGPNQAGVWWEQVAQWPSSVKNVLFFNEPNEASQSNVSPQDAVRYWREYMSPLKARGLRLGMAAPTNAPSGLQWIKDFVAACPDCTFDFIPIHYYWTSSNDFKTYVQSFHDAFPGAEIWVTEYACQSFTGSAQCSMDQTWQFHQDIVGWFNQQSWVTRYSPFGVMANMQGVNQDNALMNPDGSITALGSWYINSS